MNNMTLAERFRLFFSYLSEPVWQKRLLSGLGVTVRIAVFGLLIGIVIGTLIAVVKVAPKYKRYLRILEKICDVYVAIFRGTPMVVQLLIAYYVLLPLLGVRADAAGVGVAVFGLNSGAYVSEIMRSGLRSVEEGQMEAGRALGLSYPVTMFKIVVPQAVRNIIPTLGNEFISLIKETSVLSFIAIADLYTVFQKIVSNSYEPIVPYIAMALVYIVLVLLITVLIRLTEKLMAKSDRSRGGRNNKAKEAA